MDKDEIVKRCYRFSSLSLHAGEMAPEHVYRKRVTMTEDEKRAFPWKRDRIIIPPGTFVFMLTRECVNMPLDVEGELYMSPRVSNLGLLFFTLGHVHSGFHGRLTATLLNMTNKTIALEPSETFLHFVCHKTSSAVPPHPNHNQPQLSLNEAESNLYFNKNPGFVLTSKDFLTKKDFYMIIGPIIAIVVLVAAAVFSRAIALFFG